MSKILIVAEHDGGKLNASTAKCVTCASKVRGRLHRHRASWPRTLRPSRRKPPRSPASARCSWSRTRPTQEPLAAVLAPQIAKLAAGYTHVFGPSTTFGKDVMPRVAALLGVSQVSDIMAVEGSHTFKRPIYAGNAILTVEAPADAPVVATVRVASFEAARHGRQCRRSSKPIRASPCPRTRASSRVRLRRTGRPDLQSADTRRLGRSRARQCRELQDHLQPRRQARRGGRRLARRGRRRLRAERPAGRPDRQDHRPGGVLRDRHLRRDPAHDRHQGRAHDHRDQQGRRSADLRESPMSASSATCSRSCRSSRKHWADRRLPRRSAPGWSRVDH